MFLILWRQTKNIRSELLQRKPLERKGSNSIHTHAGPKVSHAITEELQGATRAEACFAAFDSLKGLPHYSSNSGGTVNAVDST